MAQPDDLDQFVAGYLAEKAGKEAEHQAMLARIRAEAQAEIAARQREEQRRVKELEEREAREREATIRSELKERWLAVGGDADSFEATYGELRTRYLAGKVEEEQRADEARRTQALQRALREF